MVSIIEIIPSVHYWLTPKVLKTCDFIKFDGTCDNYTLKLYAIIFQKLKSESIMS